MKAKKSLGQNFLKSSLALKKIIEAGDIEKNDVILEIGPGKGALTEKLLATGATIIAVEKDRELFEMLKIKFAEQITSRSLVLVHDDILEFNLQTSLSLQGVSQADAPRGSAGVATPDSDPEKTELDSKILNYKIIANIPYNITGAILKKFLTMHPSDGGQPKLMVLMVQNEVAKRIVARDGKESILSISVKAYGEPKLIMKVPARYFSPAPKVDSAVIEIKNISRKNFLPPLLDKEGNEGRSVNLDPLPTSPLLRGRRNAIFELRFWEIVKAGFAHKRKKLSSNLKHLPYGGNASILEKMGNKRAEDLILLDWIEFTKYLM